MLSAPRYLLGVLEIGALVGFSSLGATAIRRRLLPDLSGAPALLATTVVALALLIWAAELLGTFGAFKALPYLLVVGAVGVGLWTLLPRVAGDQGGRGRPRPQCPPDPPTGPAGRSLDVPTLIALAVAGLAVLHFATGVRARLSTGMTGFDSTWYHGPFAAGFFQSGNTWDLHYIAPQFLAWFYPSNAEIFHAAGMLAFSRDLLSPLLNLGWFIGCLLACWCVGRPYRVAPWSLVLGAIALSLPALADQAGEARSDIVGIFFLLAAVAIALNAWRAGDAEREGGAEREDLARSPSGGRSLPTGALILAGLSVGLAAGTKLNFLLPCAVLVGGLALIAPRRGRWRALAATGLAALAGGGYWYLRNLVHTGNPLPWFDHLGPISLPAPSQELGGRETHAVLGYLTDGSIWSHWFLPGLHHGFGIAWPLIAAAALAGMLLSLGRRSDPLSRVVGATAMMAALAWLVAPTSASGPDGMPNGFESGLRYLMPALVIGLALLPTVPLFRSRLAHTAAPSSPLVAPGATKGELGGRCGGWRLPAALAAAVLVAAGIGYPVQRHYLHDRYTDPSFTTPGLNAAFRWARSVSGARIATTSTRQYPLFGTDLSNHVQFVGIERPHGGFVAPSTCRTWRRLLDEGDYEYVVASRDRIEPGKPAYPPTARWTEGPGATVIRRRPPTVVFKLNGPLDPSSCPSRGIRGGFHRRPEVGDSRAGGRG
jgi:hypothetical protein